VAELSVPYSWRGRTGAVRVRVVENVDPTRVGCDRLDETLPADAASGFPLCTATPEIGLEGYSAACGWIQVVRSTDSPGAYETDPLALFRDVETPFAFFGIAPVFFDAPFRATRYDLTWTARTFLAAVPDGVMSKDVRPLAAFAWGFHVRDDVISIEDPRALDLSVWDEHTSLWADHHPHWTFEPSSAANGPS
jgi:hypothetical protein